MAFWYCLLWKCDANSEYTRFVFCFRNDGNPIIWVALFWYLPTIQVLAILVKCSTMTIYASRTSCENTKVYLLQHGNLEQLLAWWGWRIVWMGGWNFSNVRARPLVIECAMRTAMQYVALLNKMPSEWPTAWWLKHSQNHVSKESSS